MNKLALSLVLCSVPAFGVACDPGEALYFACTFSGGTKSVEICHDDLQASYRFGRTGRVPDLEISHPVADLALTPWPGVGRTIWEEVVFYNAGHSYTVHAGIDRTLPSNDDEEIVVTVFGGIGVRKGDTHLATLDCDAGSVDFPWSTRLFEAKEAEGMCFDHGDRAWVTCASTD